MPAPNSEELSMPTRVTLTEVADMTPEQRAVYEKFESNLTRALLLTKNSAAAHLALGGTFTVGLLSLLDREVIVLRVAKLRDSEFERLLHYPLARKAGLDDTEIKAIEEALYDELPAERAALVRYVTDCMVDHKASEEAYWGLRAYYSQNEIAEATHLAGHSAMTAMYLASLDIPLDESIASWGRLTEVQDAVEG
ncbi:carboxymuconolactone decarboxylase family protein [Streptomyces sp. WAC08401]|uniref:carboxymuconolactone decarboxylase family protein n=1 Tax=Streptomyces sp. WAC08401 TaxID=2487413 RepID=UPI000FA5D09B|nr:carboxymuconolactone decarboxylase family protein [Streptomyces sp. WAC08401]RSS15081.1 carboxymuconolactone decarboxylase family protein [Streptomyces sp. WAC08401]